MATMAAPKRLLKVCALRFLSRVGRVRGSLSKAWSDVMSPFLFLMLMKYWGSNLPGLTKSMGMGFTDEMDGHVFFRDLAKLFG